MQFTDRPPVVPTSPSGPPAPVAPDRRGRGAGLLLGVSPLAAGAAGRSAGR